ncbi:50S ribosomal protein L9 [Spelaeicoccus albus]|uniref:Large ribosomal subunit protein bL9 n=1 Tax=Spelaeicoccus albus TaxID=1280376 RepID=A0A7Z0AAE0_9MICO|nr:50S ribosomal protein L9 [Spelaeicoccus albus]NYI66556.1 large subunit ribosomal protein L9 [Spelaeicoccus albus]
MAKLILTHEVTGLGAPGDVVEVKNGYARNYLVPRGYAVGWNKGAEKQIEAIQAARRARAIASLDDAQIVKAKLEAEPITVTVKAGETGRLFGTVTPSDIASAVEAETSTSVDRRKVEIPVHIKTTGDYKATVRLHDDVLATLNLSVVAG